MQQSFIQLSYITTFLFWNENFYFALMDIFKNIWDSPLEYVVALFNISCNINIIKNNLNCIQYLHFFYKNNTNVLINEILSNPFTSISLANFF
jgi:hypothetical protein